MESLAASSWQKCVSDLERAWQETPLAALLKETGAWERGRSIPGAPGQHRHLALRAPAMPRGVAWPGQPLCERAEGHPSGCTLQLGAFSSAAWDISCFGDIGTFDRPLGIFSSKHPSGDSLSLLRRWTCVLCGRSSRCSKPAAEAVQDKKQPVHDTAACESPAACRRRRAAPRPAALGRACPAALHPWWETSRAQTPMASQAGASFPWPLWRQRDQEPTGAPEDGGKEPPRALRRSCGGKEQTSAQVHLLSLSWFGPPSN